MAKGSPSVDVCFILEGTYPYVAGGVSGWTHDMISAQDDFTFHLVTMLPRNADLTLKYKVPKNVKGITNIFIQDFQDGRSSFKQINQLLQQLEDPLLRLQMHGGLAEIEKIMNVIKPYRQKLGKKLLLNSGSAWEMLLRMYHATYPESSFLDYFWTWRALLGGLYSVVLTQIPPAKVYHTASTGYAGVFAARAHLETGRPVLLTEHGIYTNERRIEIEMADWLYETKSNILSIDELKRELKDAWISSFISYSRACYEASSKIITLYEGNQKMQIEDGADPEKLEIIPNGIEYEHYSAIKRDGSQRPPTIALIGRVVPIKDVKTFLRACAVIRGIAPDVRALIMGPTDEDEDYFKECQNMVNYLGLHNMVSFTGRVKLEEYLGRVDVIVLTSISEAMPLVILEAGAAGIPSVATDVGACREMILGNSREKPQLGPGGAVTPSSNPNATALAVLDLLTNREWYKKCSRTIQECVRMYYNKKDLDATYRNLYKKFCSVPDSLRPEKSTTH